MSLRITIISPHCDDAAYSLTLSMWRLISNGAALKLINCFTVTRWTAVPVDTKDIKEISLLRAAEDAAFNNYLGSAINVINLDLLDAPLRSNYIFQYKPLEPEEWNLIDELSEKLELNAEGILLCPLGIGNHIDHAVCLEAVLKLYKKLKVVFYEDLPYAARVGFEDIRLRVKSLEDRLSVKMDLYIHELKSCNVDKELAVRVYKSQMNDDICSEILSHMQALQGERLWAENYILNELKESLKCL